MSVSTNETDLTPLIEIVIQHNGIVLNGHDHCLGHFYNNDTNFILSGAAGYPQAGDCNNGVALGPYALYLAANNLTGKLNPNPCTKKRCEWETDREQRQMAL
jgi:tartrate-resistant acid phosphatase type 5